MNNNNIRIIKEHILASPDLKYTLNELKASLISYGITEQEFNEAIRQLAQPALSSKQTQETKPNAKQIQQDADEFKKEIDSAKKELTSAINNIKNELHDTSKGIQTTNTALKKELEATKSGLDQSITELQKELKQKKNSQPIVYSYNPPTTTMTPTMQLKRLMIATLSTKKAVVILFMLFGVLFSSLLILKTYMNQNTAVSTYQAVDVVKTQQNALVSQVYANTQAVNPFQVFSYPPSNITLTIQGTPKKEVLGFFPYWMLDEQDKISLNEVTSISLFGIEVDGGGNIITGKPDGKIDEGWNMWNNPKLNQFITRARKRHKKIFLTVKAFNNDNIEKLIASDKAQVTVIANILHLLNEKSLDGINIDFEYVGNANQTLRDEFSRFITNVNVELKKQYSHTSLTIDTYINSASVQGIFDVQALASQSDALVIMGYDIHTPNGDPGPVSPMEGEVSIITLMQSYLEKIDPEKLILAVPYYGYDWPIKNGNNQNNGHTVPYAEIIGTNKDSNILWDDNTQTPWYQYIDPITKEQHVVHFDNVRSLGIKYDYVNRKNLKGIGIWAMGYDGLNADLRELILEKFAQ